VSVPPRLNGCIRHFLLTIELNFRNPQAVAYGYLVPVVFLLGFGGVFRADDPPLLAHMGQIVTITILGGACFGLPTALVAEREQGVWRRYRLLPVPTASLILSAMLARTLIVASSVLVQIALAHAIFGTPLPIRPGPAAVAVSIVTAGFLGIGFLIAALANNVPAVQALGQCVFLPMILIGGVGVPLAVLPFWAQRIAGFMPGRYAVEILQPCFSASQALHGNSFRFGALVVIGLAGGIAGAKLFRWEASPRTGHAHFWVAAALTSWAAVGAIAWQTGRLQPVLPESAAWTNITEAQIAEISFNDLPKDGDMVAPVAQLDPDPAQTKELARKLASWPPGKLDDSGQSIRNLISLAAVADLSADPRESNIARLVFQQVKSGFEPSVARQALSWTILSPEDGQVVRKAPELGLFRHPPERLVRQRCVLYAEKFLGRLLGKIPE
jgi:ABC-type transport system involved in cytochrome c biogenesis permease component